MKNTLFLIIIGILLTSCENKKITELNTKILELKKQNKILSDSLSKHDYSNLINSELLGIPHNDNLVPNQENKFTFFFTQDKTLPKYNLYQIVKSGDTEKRKLILENHDKSRFDFNFIPKTKDESEFDLRAIFDLDSVTIEINAGINMNLSQ